MKQDITEASRTGRPPSILLAGTLGSGKTMTVQQMTIAAALRGSLVVDIDPKPDHNLEHIPELENQVHVIELSGDDRYRGLLDPLITAPESIREDLASAYFMDLLPGGPVTWQTQVRKAVRAVMEHPDACSLRVLDYLNGSAGR